MYDFKKHEKKNEQFYYQDKIDSNAMCYGLDEIPFTMPHMENKYLEQQDQADMEEENEFLKDKLKTNKKIIQVNEDKFREVNYTELFKSFRRKAILPQIDPFIDAAFDNYREVDKEHSTDILEYQLLIDRLQPCEPESQVENSLADIAEFQEDLEEALNSAIIGMGVNINTNELENEENSYLNEKTKLKSFLWLSIWFK